MKRFFLIFFLLVYQSVFAQAFKEVVIFGDSLSDDGNLYSIMKVLPKSPPYFQGRFTNGPTWAEYVGNYYYKTQYADYSNYAYGGATTILHHLRTDTFIAPVILEEEIDGYFLRSKNKDKRHSLYGIWIGANDYLYEKTPDIQTLTDNVVNKTLWAMRKLLESGGQNIFILNLPDFSQIPFAKNHGNGERLGNIARMHNQKLLLSINQLKLEFPHAKITLFNIYDIFVDLLTNPEKYNQKYNKHVTDVTHSCWLGSVLGHGNVDNSSRYGEILGKHMPLNLIIDSFANGPKTVEPPCSNPSSYLFWDDMHPTAVVHEVLANIVIETLESL